MFLKAASAALAILFAAGAMSAEASADHRKRHRARINAEFYAGPEVVRVPRAMRFMFGGYELTPEEYDEVYGEDVAAADPQQFDEDYYEPQAVKPESRVKPKAALPKPVAKPVAAVKKAVATASASKPAGKTAPAEALKPASGSTALTCDKAGQIVSGYGFTGVKPHACAGKVFEFDASRDGKDFAIKLDSTNGELTEVRKLN